MYYNCLQKYITIGFNMRNLAGGRGFKGTAVLMFFKGWTARVYIQERISDLGMFIKDITYPNQQIDYWLQ